MRLRSGEKLLRELLSPRIHRKLVSLDICTAFVRHITQPGVDRFLAELEAGIGEREPRRERCVCNSAPQQAFVQAELFELGWGTSPLPPRPQGPGDSGASHTAG